VLLSSAVAAQRKFARQKLGGKRMATMIAARLHAYGSPMTLDRIEVPEPRPTDVLVEVKACGVVPNLARVVSNFFGSLTPDNKMMPPLPAIFGLDPTGVVAKVGAQVFSIRPGDRVYVNPARSCGSCKMCRSGKELDCPSFTLQGYFGRSQDIMRAYPYGGLAQFITARPRRGSAISAPLIRR
jgi:D-arabinose 1-dehydrogenase-like Zn-dependent alcohol dehydrogenase